MTYLMGIDNGGTMTKASLFDAQGREIAVAAENTPLITPRPGYYERDMTLLWQTNAACIREVIRKAGVSPRAIAGIGCTGHGKGLYVWGKDGRPACPGIASTDRRAAAVVSRWLRDGTAQKASRFTLQSALACQPAALLAWLKEQQPEVYANIRWVLACKDYIRFRLTGEARAERTDYSGSGLMNLQTQVFDRSLLELYQIGEMYDCLPALCRSDEYGGGVSREAAGETGLAEGTPVCGGMFDIDACAVAMDVMQPERLCTITGTWSINEYPSFTPVQTGLSTRNSLFCLPGLYLVEESSPTSAGNLDWFIRCFMQEEQRQGSAYKAADAMVGTLPAEESPVLFLPYLYGSHSGEASAVFAGLSSEHGKAHMLRAVYEGVAYSHWYHIEKLLRHREAPSAIRMAGGAARSPVWVQMFADVMDSPIEVVSAKELGALGAAMAAAVCAGVYGDYRQAAAAMVHRADTVPPDRRRTNIYREKYARYREWMTNREDRRHGGESETEGV